MSPNSSNSACTLTSSKLVTAEMSSSLTKPEDLQQPRHRSAHVEATDRQLCVCERSSHPRLNRCLTSTEVAGNECNISISTIKHCRHTWNYEVVKGHAGKAWIRLVLLIPPPKWIFYIFRVWVEIQHKFIDHGSIMQGSEGQKVVKSVFRRLISCLIRSEYYNWTWLTGSWVSEASSC